MFESPLLVRKDVATRGERGTLLTQFRYLEENEIIKSVKKENKDKDGNSVKRRKTGDNGPINYDSDKRFNNRLFTLNNQVEIKRKRGALKSEPVTPGRKFRGVYSGFLYGEDGKMIDQTIKNKGKPYPGLESSDEEEFNDVDVASRSGSDLGEDRLAQSSDSDSDSDSDFADETYRLAKLHQLNKRLREVGGRHNPVLRHLEIYSKGLEVLPRPISPLQVVQDNPVTMQLYDYPDLDDRIRTVLTKNTNTQDGRSTYSPKYDPLSGWTGISTPTFTTAKIGNNSSTNTSPKLHNVTPVKSLPDNRDNERFDTPRNSPTPQMNIPRNSGLARNVNLNPGDDEWYNFAIKHRSIGIVNSLLHLSLLRGDYHTAFRAFALLIRCQYVDVRIIWTIGLELLVWKRELREKTEWKEMVNIWKKEQENPKSAIKKESGELSDPNSDSDTGSDSDSDLDSDSVSDSDSGSNSKAHSSLNSKDNEHISNSEGQTKNPEPEDKNSDTEDERGYEDANSRARYMVDTIPSNMDAHTFPYNSHALLAGKITNPTENIGNPSSKTEDEDFLEWLLVNFPYSRTRYGKGRKKARAPQILPYLIMSKLRHSNPRQALDRLGEIMLESPYSEDPILYALSGIAHIQLYLLEVKEHAESQNGMEMDPKRKEFLISKIRSFFEQCIARGGVVPQDFINFEVDKLSGNISDPENGESEPESENEPEDLTHIEDGEEEEEEGEDVVEKADQLDGNMGETEYGAQDIEDNTPDIMDRYDFDEDPDFVDKAMGFDQFNQDDERAKSKHNPKMEFDEFSFSEGED